MTAYRIDDYMHALCDAAIEPITSLAVVPPIVDLEVAAGVGECWDNVSKRKAALPQTSLILGIAPYEFRAYYSPMAQ
jgi:hypothetical protein